LQDTALVKRVNDIGRSFPQGYCIILQQDAIPEGVIKIPYQAFNLPVAIPHIPASS
jgi:hypothetical protein